MKRGNPGPLFRWYSASRILVALFLLVGIPIASEAYATGKRLPGGNEVSEKQSENGSLEIHLALCDQSYAIEEIFEACHGTGIEGLEVSLDDSGGLRDYKTGQKADPSSSGPGIVRFEALPPDGYDMYLESPGNLASSYVYCSVADSENPVDVEETDLNWYHINLTSGLNVICDWYLVERGYPATMAEITVAYFSCPDGYKTESLDALLDNCPETSETIWFHVDALDRSGSFDTSTSIASDESSGAWSAEVTPGVWRIGIYSWNRPREPIIWCRLNDSQPIEVKASHSNAILELEAGDTVSCDWFGTGIVLSRGSELQINFGLCFTSTVGDYLAECTLPTPDVIFTLGLREKVIQSFYLERDQSLFFWPQSSGAFTLTGTLMFPDTVKRFHVVCQSHGIDVPVSYEESDSDTMTVTIELPSSGLVRCNWYAIPFSIG